VFELDNNNNFTDKTSLILKSKLVDKDFYIVDFIILMLSSGLNSPLYKMIREDKGLVYFIDCSLNKKNDKADIEISTLTSNKNVKEVLDSISEIFNNIEKYLTKERFNIVKNSILINMRKQEINRHSNIEEWLYPDDWNIHNKIDELTLEKCLEEIGRAHV